MQLQWAILSACVLLLVGFVLRAKLRFIQLFFVPASVVGGLVGLICVQVGRQVPAVAEPVDQVAATLRGWPAPLIAVVFAGLLLERPKRGFRVALRGAALEGIMVWIIVLGQVALGLGATWLVIRHAFDVPAAFGQLIEAGFAGGHGTATALGVIFEEALDFPAGRDLGLASATVGLVWSVVSGIVFVNIGVRRGWTRAGAAEAQLVSGLERRRDPKPMAFARVRSEVIDPLVFQVLIVGLAFLVGAALRWGFIRCADLVSSADAMRFVGNVPLFLFTLLGGWLLRGAMTWLALDDLIDDESVRRIVAIAMEFLIVAAIASLRIEVIKDYGGPLALLCGIGFVWTAVCLFGLSRHILPREHWFELGIINYGMSTGTTAQGMLLLRIVDKDLETGAAEEYALAAPLSAPFIGGGVLTMTMPLILTRFETPVVIFALLVATAALFFTGRQLNAARRAPP